MGGGRLSCLRSGGNGDGNRADGRRRLDGRLMKNEKVTSLDVAKLAGVSQSAVVAILHARHVGVEEDVREGQEGRRRSRLSAEHYRALADHRPEPHHRPRGRLSRELFLPRGRRAAVESACRTRAITCWSSSRRWRLENVDQITQEILDYQVDGIVLASANMSSDLAARCHASGVPIVLFNRLQDDPRLSAVTSDNRAGGRKLAEYLVSLGHQRFGYIAGFEGASTQRDREQGFREGLELAGHSSDTARGRQLPLRGRAGSRAPHVRRRGPTGPTPYSSATTTWPSR